jgi:SAM-dependent methyltransferase
VTTGGSVSFDRAAAFYDQTRRLSPPAQAAVTALLVGELRDYGPALEVGIGTGRMALPIAARGIPVTGVDISPAMLAKLGENAPAGAPVSATIADATALPFPSAIFGSAYACHVLHLIPNWLEAVDELWRVVRPGGRILIDPGGFTDVVNQIQQHLAVEAGMPPRRHPGMTSTDDLDRIMIGRGAVVRVDGPIPDIRSVTISGVITAFELNVFSWTWPLDDDTRRRAAAATRQWAEQSLGPLHEMLAVNVPISWRVYDLPT